MRKAELLATLNNFLIEQYAAGRRVLLIVDEAQNLSMRVLEEIRMLSGRRDHQGEGAAHHPRRPARAQRQARRPGARAADAARAPALSPADALSESETRGYIQHRLEVAGAGDRELFAPDTYPDDLPLHRRRAAPDQHPVRHCHDGGVHRRSRHRHARRYHQRRAGAAVGRLRASPAPSRGRGRAACRRRGPVSCGRAPVAGAPAGRHRRPHRAGDAAAHRARDHRPHARTTTCTSTAASSAATTARSSPRRTRA